MSITKQVVLYNKCNGCHSYFKPKDRGMIFDPLCSRCIEKKNNQGKYAGFKDDRGHYLIFQSFGSIDRYEPYCEKCRCFVIQTKSKEPSIQ